MIGIFTLPGIGIGVARKHICSHLLDRSLFTSGDGFLGLSPSDTDPQHGPMAIRDSFVFSLHLAPEKIFKSNYKNLETSLYFDYAYSLPGSDPLNGARYTRPSYMTSRYFNMGIQATHYFEYDTTTYSLAGSFPAGYRKSVDFLGLQINAFGQMFRGKVKEGGYHEINE